MLQYVRYKQSDFEIRDLILLVNQATLGSHQNLDVWHDIYVVKAGWLDTQIKTSRLWAAFETGCYPRGLSFTLEI